MSPNALSFSEDAFRLYGGLSGAVALIPLSIPGTNTHVTLDINTSEDPRGGQRGIVSTIAVGSAPLALDDSGGLIEIIAVGTFAGDVGLYVTEPSWIEPLIEETVSPRHGSHKVVAAGALCVAGWHMGSGSGIQQVRLCLQLVFHPVHKHILFVSTRRSPHIHVLDTRYLYGMVEPFHFARLGDETRLSALLQRNATDTHQRLWIDISDDGRWVVSGDQDGMVRVWDCEELEKPGVHVPAVEWKASRGASY